MLALGYDRYAAQGTVTVYVCPLQGTCMPHATLSHLGHLLASAKTRLLSCHQVLSSDAR